MTTDEWALLTDAEVREVVEAAGCKNCQYRGGRANSGMPVHCDYLGITGHRRGCTIDECPHGRVSGKRPRHKVQPKALKRQRRVKQPKRPVIPTGASPAVRIGDWMMAGLARKNMDISGVARAMGVSETSVYNWRDGIAKPTDKNLHKLAELLEIDINEVKGGEA